MNYKTTICSVDVLVILYLKVFIIYIFNVKLKKQSTK